MRPQIIHPPGTLGSHNAHMLDQMTIAYRTALQLAERGHAIEKIVLTHLARVIWLQHTPACATFEAVTIVESHAPARRTVRAAVLNGVQLKWRVGK